MKRFSLYIAYIISFGAAFAQQEKRYAIPAFEQIPAKHRWDSIHQWYTDNITIPEARHREKLQLLTKVRAYAQHSSDPIIECSVLFLWGWFELHNVKDTAQGLADISKACAIADKNGLYNEWAIFTMHLAGYYSTLSTAKTLEYLMRADEVMRRTGYSETDAGLSVSMKLADIMWHVNNNRGCLDIQIPLVKLLERKGDSSSMISVNNTIGLAYREMKKTDSALFYFRKVLALSEMRMGKDWIALAYRGIVPGNIAALYLAEHRLDSAIVYARHYYQWQKDHPDSDPNELAESLILLSAAYVELHKADTVLPMLLEAERILNGKPHLKLYDLLADIYHKKGNHKVAGRYLQKTLEVQEKRWQSYTLDTYIHGQEQLEAEKSIRKIKDVENAIRLSEQRRNFFIVGLCLVGLILFTLYRRQQLKSKKNKELFESREQLLFAEKKRAEENLQNYMLNLQEKNRLIEDVEREIALLGENTPDKRVMYETLNNLKRTTIITSDDWEHFKTLFEKVYSGFFSRLKEKFPDITPAEMRLMALIKLDIPNRKMADMLGISYETIRKTKYRFIKKRNVTETTDLSKIVNSL